MACAVEIVVEVSNRLVSEWCRKYVGRFTVEIVVCTVETEVSGSELT